MIKGICNKYLSENPRAQTEDEFNEINLAYELFNLHKKIKNL